MRCILKGEAQKSSLPLIFFWGGGEFSCNSSTGPFEPTSNANVYRDSPTAGVSQKLYKGGVLQYKWEVYCLEARKVHRYKSEM